MSKKKKKKTKKGKKSSNSGSTGSNSTGEKRLSKSAKNNTHSQEAKNLYIQTNLTLQAISDYFEGERGTSMPWLCVLSAREGWKKLRQQHRKEIEKATSKKIINSAAKSHSEQAIRNIGRCELMISKLIDMLEGKIFEDDDFKDTGQALGALKKVMEMQNELYKPVEEKGGNQHSKIEVTIIRKKKK